MHSHFNALGFINTDQEWMEEITKEVCEFPDKRYVLGIGENETYSEFYKFYGDDFGIKISCSILEKEDEINVFDIDTFVQDGEQLLICDIVVGDMEQGRTREYGEIAPNSRLQYVICEENETGIELEFSLQNTIDYTRLANKGDINAKNIKIAALACAGTIVLPIEKSDEDLAYEDEYKQWYQDQLQRSREGDFSADAVLDNEFWEMSNEIFERLGNEDFLSVVEGYLYHDDDRRGFYFVLGDIEKIEQEENKKTGKKIYKILVRVMSIKVNAYIPVEELIGFPIVGMRFMGVCRLQGEVAFDV